ncbi:uncharacterized protein CC84DRAFT_1221344 [Paraphaeosphaeria sporulosa]|uniref:Uncharacterized protein n=1 Tax=Paraphaeosphaeria sporulosa TaxID=1460663 RepID=A0A177C1R0_9PLEO|nr:uncharacterized protein CC84DRAFT_1221344 [Paraphaeosphaeria sporulosa]OAG00772.1 hypothetical protein CC84DRAFT_1221344 [Paraphaeosphaeria sporulosa]
MINTTSLNPVDRWLREKVTKFMSHRVSDKNKELWVESLTKVLLGLSDQQLVTCLAVFVVAIVKMVIGSITAGVFWDEYLARMGKLKEYDEEHDGYENSSRWSSDLGPYRASQ